MRSVDDCLQKWTFLEYKLSQRFASRHHLENTRTHSHTRLDVSLVSRSQLDSHFTQAFRIGIAFDLLSE